MANVETNPSGITYKDVWWTSTWPLVLVAIFGAAILGETPNQRPAVGAAFFWGSVFAGMYAKNPVPTYRQAFIMAARVAIPVQAALGLVLFFVFSRIGADLDLAAVLVEVVVAAIIMSAVWTFFIVRKGKKLVARHRSSECASRYRRKRGQVEAR